MTTTEIRDRAHTLRGTATHTVEEHGQGSPAACVAAGQLTEAARLYRRLGLTGVSRHCERLAVLAAQAAPNGTADRDGAIEFSGWAEHGPLLIGHDRPNLSAIDQNALDATPLLWQGSDVL